MSTLREYEQALERDPTQKEPFLALRKAYRESGTWDKLITLYEMRAQALTDAPKASELFYLAAEIRLDHLDDSEGAEADLAHAIDRDPENAKAAHRLKLLYRQQGRPAEYMTMLEVEAGAVGHSKDPARIAELSTELGLFAKESFAKLERAAGLSASQRQAEVTPEALKLVESARKIYRALGDFQSVVRLYELELSLTSEAKRRSDLLLGLGRVQGEKLGDLEGAAQRLGEVVRLRPRDDRALEALAAVYANPGWLGSDGKERAATTYYQIARRRHEAGDVDNAVAALRKALAAIPGHNEASELLEQVLYAARRLADLDLYYRERVAEAGNLAADATPDQQQAKLEEKMDFLFKRAQLAEGDRQDLPEALRIYQEIVAIEPPGGPASQRLVELFGGQQDWARLADLREKQLERIEDPTFRLGVLTELALLYRDRLGDPEQAAVYWHAILQESPNHPEALTAYAEHFRERGDWPALVELLEFSFEHARGSGRPLEELLERLEEIAVISESKLSDSERALSAWQRMDELSPGHDRAREAQKRILQKGKQWDRMVTVLEREAQTASDPAQKVESLRRLARVQVEKLNAGDRAAQVYQQILALEPKDPVTIRSLIDLYERDERWGDLATLLRDQLEGSTSKQEKAANLRRLLMLYTDRLNQLAEGSWAAAEILKLAPGDRDALERLETILEQSDDKERLIETLEYHTRYAANNEEKLRLFLRIADLLQNQIGDEERAMRWWEEILRLAPGDATALDALAAGYERLGRPEDLAKVLEQQIAQAAQDPSVQASGFRRLAELAEGKLADPGRAQRAWEELLRATPSDPPALEALSRIYADKKEWRTLVSVLERRIPLAADPLAAVALALERARIFEEELRIRSEAVAALEQIVEELDPRCLPAFERLRRLAEAGGDWLRVVAVAEKQLFLEEDSDVKAERALEIGVLWRDRLGDHKRAMAAFERTVEIDPGSPEALSALAALYTQAGEWQRLIVTDEKLLDQLAQGHPDTEQERWRLMFEIGDTADQHLGDSKTAFEWYRRAYNEGANPEALTKLEDVAQRHALWDELVQVFEGARARATDPAGQVAIARKIAGIVETSLGDAGRAFSGLREALAAEPAATTLLPELERLAEAADQWDGLLEVYAQVARHRRDPGERLALLRKRAEVREQKLSDPYGAMDEQLRAFALMPDEEDTRLEIGRLAEITGRWEDALGIEAQRFARAREDAGEAKVEIACRAAALVEEKLKDRRRAFRAYLNAFRLAPENASVVANLWRLAALVEEDATTRPAGAKGGPERTMELSLTDISAMSAVPKGGPERTMELSLADVAAMSAAVMSRSGEAALEPEPEIEATEELIESELIEEVEEDADADQITPVGTGEDLEQADQGRARPPRRVVPLPPPTPSPIVRTPPPVVSAWAEFAQAYELLPAPDTISRHKHLRKVAEIWERGSKDIDRALTTLERAFRLDLSDQTVRNELRRIATEKPDEVDRWDAVCAIFQRAADAANRDEAVSLHHEVARFREELGQHEQAEACYQAILMLKPEDEVALAHLETVLRTQERWPELAALLDKRTTGSLEALPPGTVRRQRTLELAELYDTRLERPYEAIDTFERFVGSTDEDGRGADAPQVVRENADALEALARLYAKVGMWNKAVEALQRQIELGPEPERLRTLKLRLAEYSERELGQVDQAVAALESILESSPRDLEVLAALDRLLEGQGRYEALQEVIARRVELASESDKRLLIRRRATILEERLGNADAAAAALRSLGAEAVRDEETLAALLRNLGRAGLAHEALRVLAQKIELLNADRAPADRVAALHLEVATLRLDRLDDVSGARTSIEEALKLQPDRAEALGALARLHLRASDFPAYARTRAREAAVLRSGAPAAEAWLDAGRVFRDQLSDGEQARSCFEKALAADPHSAGALRALASLLAAEGRAAEARALYERQLELVDDPAAKAAVLTDLARALLVEKPGEVNLAVARLDEALDLVPDHLPAVISMADIFYREQQWAEAERRLLQATRRLKGQPAEMAQLYHRLGEVYDKLGRLDEGYRQLQEADRMVPGQLLIRLALGENRFQAKKWREATSYLDGLGDHADAHKYPMEVAEGLAHGASAEVRLKRPERAVALYQAALRWMPDHRPSLQALADLALERGEGAEAAQHLRRLAEGSGDRAERTRLFEQLGDVVQSLGDDVGACKAYTEALAQMDQPTEAQAGLLDKAFASQRTTGADKDAASTLQRLIALTPDPRQRAARRREAALLFEQQGEHGQAGELLEQALEENPKDEAVLAAVVAAYERGKRKAELEKVLSATLPALDAVADNPKVRARRAELWEKLAELRKRKNKDGAIEALETAVSIDGGRVSARSALAKLYGDKAEHTQAALDNHRHLVRVDVTREDSLRRLASAYMDEGRFDAARCCLDVLSLLGLADKEDRAFLAAHPQPERRPEDPYATAIEDADRAKYLAHPEARAMAEVFAAIWEGVPGLGLQTLDSLGLTAQDKVSPIADVMIAQIFSQTAKALGNRRASLYVSPRPEFSGISILLPPPPAIVVGQGVTDQEAPALRFLLGRALELTRPEYILATGMDRREFGQLFTSVLKAFHPRHAKWRAGEAGSEQAQKLKKALPYKLAKRLAELFQEHESTPWGSARWRTVVAETGNRTGLVLCGDLSVAARIVLAESGAGGDLDAAVVREQAGQPTPLRELLRYALSEEYFAAREILGTAVSSKAAA